MEKANADSEKELETQGDEGEDKVIIKECTHSSNHLCWRRVGTLASSHSPDIWRMEDEQAGSFPHVFRSQFYLNYY